ncbi:pyridoxamine 5'-phosphate oxidase family protein [Streptomyces sp. NBC_01451]|uniref:pyridoxamine 5'-phosphate oxidase family protein n=1 Tax=Streptomyces sp. NBC_01451 TaxID=2903872 RepID=UPI002E30109F|nr:pyridoxamine 5'-phosphate oxidase family protein [Streptomyces sp. NBC_01451]
MDEQVKPGAVKGSPTSDLGRRLTRRREELGLSRREAAERAGMAPGYLQYLEEQPATAPGMSALLRLAGALRTTVRDLTGSTLDLPPGAGRASPHPQFTELSKQECRALLATHGVGRVAVPTVSGPVVVPVNYSVVEGAIVFRTADGTTPAQAAGCQVAFEVDRIDEAFSQGWSVLVRGHARTVTAPDDVRHLTERAYSLPWAGGERDVWVRIDPLALTGRRITV